MPVTVTLCFQILADNLIERLPMNLGKLQSLKVMTLDGNRITTLPDECNFFKYCDIKFTLVSFSPYVPLKTL